MTSNATTFKEAYATLQKHAQALRNQQEPDIDNLTTIVSESVEAYRICKQRIDAVEQALEASLADAQLGDETATAIGHSPATPGASPEDDVPF